MTKTKTFTETFIGRGNETFTFKAETMKEIVSLIIEKVKDPRYKFSRSDAIGMFRGSIIRKLEQSKDTKTLAIVRKFIAEKS